MSNPVKNERNIVFNIKQEVRNLRVRSKFYDSDMIIEERYCTDPNCHCRDVTLTFYQVEENENEGTPLFRVRLNLDTLDILDREVYDKTVKYEKIVCEMLSDLSDEVKLRFNTHYNTAKGIEAEKTSASISQKVKEYTLKGNCVAYHEVFETLESVLFKDDKDNLIYIEDLHCMNPKCLCNEVFLTFIDVNEAESSGENIFTIRYSLKNGKYELDKQQCSDERMKVVLKSFMGEENKFREKFKQRYKAMKEVGETIFRESKEVSKDETAAVKVGRNDTCPCGSGKKYKKCCGK